MGKMLYYCEVCKEYTLSPKICTKCKTTVRTAHPPKFSPVDKYQKYRIPMFKKKFKNRTEEKN